ncbi:MAG: preprotein translocase subunit YajC [Dongiaceae bacterium]
MFSTAFAQTADTAAGSSNFLVQMAPIFLIFLVFYFLLIRPQQKKLQAHQAMVKNLRRGDKVVLGGGILGTIERVVDDKEIIVKIAEGTEVRALKESVATVLAKPGVSDAITKDAA